MGPAERPAARRAPRLSDGTLDGIVAAIVVEDENIGPTRYIARLTVLFDRARAGGMLGSGGGAVLRSAPMLVIPVEWSGGAPDSFEARGPWQRAWARFRTGSSPIDYVRPSGVGPDALLLNVGQAGRRGRGWWRMLLDQYGAADVIVPTVHVARQWPGGPVVARFVAIHGPDDTEIARFTLKASGENALDRVLDEGVRRIDAAYAGALRQGALHADPTLAIEQAVPLDLAPAVEGPAAGEQTTVMMVFADTLDEAAVNQVETAFAGLPGVQASIASLAVGGVSTIRLAYSGDLPTLRYLLDQRGWRIDDAAGGPHLRRRAEGEAALPPPPPPPPTTTAKPAAAAKATTPSTAKPAAAKATAAKSASAKTPATKTPAAKAPAASPPAAKPKPAATPAVKPGAKPKP